MVSSRVKVWIVFPSLFLELLKLLTSLWESLPKLFDRQNFHIYDPLHILTQLINTIHCSMRESLAGIYKRCRNFGTASLEKWNIKPRFKLSWWSNLEKLKGSKADNWSVGPLSDPFIVLHDFSKSLVWGSKSKMLAGSVVNKRRSFPSYSHIFRAASHLRVSQAFCPRAPKQKPPLQRKNERLGASLWSFVIHSYHGLTVRIIRVWAATLHYN